MVPTTMNLAWVVLAIVAWGALAFGAVYDWAYWPLLGAAAGAGVWGLVKRVPRVRRRGSLPLAIGLLLIAVAIGIQLVPLDRQTLVELSPATDDFLRQYNVPYALRVALAETGADVASAGTPASHPLSINPGKTWLGLAFLAGLGLLLLGLIRGLDGWDLRTIAPGLAVLGVVMALTGIIQKATWNGKVYGFWEPINADAVAFGPFINRNHFAGWMLLALPVVIGYFAAQIARGMVGVKPDWRSRVMWFATPDANRAVLTGFSIVVMGLALAMTLSRSGITGFLLAILLSGIQALRHQRTALRRRLLTSYLVLAFAAAVTWAGIDAIAARFSLVDWELGGRAGAWADAWNIHLMFPVFGTGFNTYGTATLLLQKHDLASHYAEAHSDYLQLLTEGGWMVALPILLTLVLFAGEVWGRFQDARDDLFGYWLRLGAVTGILAMAFQETVEFSLQMPGNAVLFVLLAALAVRRSSAAGWQRNPD
jgi:hypothetical protein